MLRNKSNDKWVKSRRRVRCRRLDQVDSSDSDRVSSSSTILDFLLPDHFHDLLRSFMLIVDDDDDDDESNDHEIIRNGSGTSSDPYVFIEGGGDDDIIVIE